VQRRTLLKCLAVPLVSLFSGESQSPREANCCPYNVGPVGKCVVYYWDSKRERWYTTRDCTSPVNP
jgi:hypothetical protein